MLVCSVSQLQRRVGIAAELTEATAAVDAPGTGNVVFATLVDDPASLREQFDAYLGEIMVEAASAATTLNAGLLYAVAISEATIAIDICSAQVPRAGSVAEAASAADLVDCTKIAGLLFEGVVALDGPIMPATPQPTVIFIEG